MFVNFTPTPTIYINVKIVTGFRISSIREIKLALFIAGVEQNPGPLSGQASDQEYIKEIEIISINCNGLTSNLRLLQAVGRIKKHIRQKDCIIFLQETHNANIILLENIWSGSVHISMGTGGSRGVITLCTPRIITKSFKTDHEGRFLFTTVEIGKNRFINTANIYSPNDHDLSYQFITEVFNEWKRFCLIATSNVTDPPQCSMIIGGDFNCVLNCQDAQNRSWNPKERRLADHIKTHIEGLDLYDSVLRSSNGNNFTWNRGKTFSKIDHIFVSEDILTSTNRYNTIWDLVKSDHAAIQISLKVNSCRQRGRSYPKLSLLDLKDEGRIAAVKEEIDSAIRNFPPYWNPHLKLDFVKLVIRTKILELRGLKKLSKDSIQLLRTELENFNSLPNLDEQQTDAFSKLRTKLYRAEELESEKLKLAAGIKWREQGERSNKFFLNAINSNRAQTTMDFLITPNGTTNGIKDMLNFSKEFYSKLYEKQPTHHVGDFYRHCPKLEDSAQEDLSKPLTISDLKSALKSCKDSTPGLDGIPYSFYKIFGNQLLPLILDAWEYSNVTGCLPQSQSTSVISLIPKSGKDKHDIKNWRPISISSCDLKIITKAYSIKVGKYLGDIISDSQMGYVPGRDINFNNRLLRTALNHCDTSKLDYVLMSLDAQKAYDSVDHEYISNTLAAYGFPKEFITVVNVLHKNLLAQVQVNGFLSESFSIQRGVKQGDALSCALFILAIDPLIRNIESNPNVPALTLNNDCVIKTLAYADDIAIVTENSDVFINEAFSEYMKLTLMSGLTLNANKTEILNLCESQKQSSSVFYLNNPLDILHKSETTICGNLLSRDQARCYEVNITQKIVKLSNQLNKWKNRNLTINGKMIILKTFAISQLIFTSQFQVIRPKDVRRIEHLCYSFVWNGTDRVKRCYLKSEREEGGINGIDIESFLYSIAVRQFFKSNHNPKLASINNSSVIKEDIKLHARIILRKILLYQVGEADMDVAADRSWIEQTRTEFFLKPYSKAHVLVENLGITNIASISMTDSRRGIINQIKRALPPKVTYLTNMQPPSITDRCEVTISFKGKLKHINKATSRELNCLIKTILRKNVAYHPAEKYPINKSLFSDIRNTWQNLWQISNPTLRAIRLKVLYKDIWCQEKRFKLGIIQNPSCTICGESESVLHQLFLCTNAQKIWSIGSEVMNSVDPSSPRTNIEFCTNMIEVSKDTTTEIIKAVILKLLIQIDRSKDISEQDVRRSLLHYLNIEYSALSKRFKNNVTLLNNLHYAISKLTQ